MSLTAAGLSTEEAERRSATEGPNRLPRPPRPAPLRQLARQFTHLLAVLLWVAAGLALLAGLPPLAVAIVAVVVLNAVFAFAQEHRADKSAERLDAMLPTSVRVRRDGVLCTVDATDLVRDDLVVLIAGDRVAADARLAVAHASRSTSPWSPGRARRSPARPGRPCWPGRSWCRARRRRSSPRSGPARSSRGSPH